MSYEEDDEVEGGDGLSHSKNGGASKHIMFDGHEEGNEKGD